jgi:capsular polysaccharide transport system permease protein
MKLSTATRRSSAGPPAVPGPPPGPVVAPGLEPRLPPTAAEAARALPRRRGFVMAVIAPLILAAVYLFGFAADQYVSEARFMLRDRQGSSMANPLGDLLGAAAGASSGNDGIAVRDYLLSLDALNDLRRVADPVAIWRRAETDPIARLWWAEPRDEHLLWHYRRMVSVLHEPTTGVTVIEVRAFTPEDSRMIAERLLMQAEAFVNRLSERMRTDSLLVARAEVELAERRVLAARDALTRFRQQQTSLDPARDAAVGVESVGRLDALLAQTRAELQERLGFMRPDNPQILLLRNRIDSLEREIVEARRRLVAGDGAFPQQLAAFERLMLEREFADRQLASAIGSLETARIDAQRQQLFLARVVEPNLAQYPLHPRSIFILVTLAAVLLMLYGVGWLIAAGIREHARL